MSMRCINLVCWNSGKKGLYSYEPSSDDTTQGYLVNVYWICIMNLKLISIEGNCHIGCRRFADVIDEEECSIYYILPAPTPANNKIKATPALKDIHTKRALNKVHISTERP